MEAKPQTSLSSGIKRHLPPILARIPLAVVVTYAMSLSHNWWGGTYPGDGQKAFAFLILFGLIGLGAALTYFVLGSLCQFLLRKRPVRFTWIADGALCGLFTLILLIAGANTHYQETPTGQTGDRGTVHHERH